ncbi:Cyclic pyranopterin monophosphate synthase accessory protein [Rubripirellula lacrimiformis]|uniref:Cyclic pyranopterin monophosphate synthase n=1 Tax=Rubripirellula lacrimiformis TaxID=1930273 RepID=A0A517N8G4_9BACT|nr:cyclic pyranopterin monophosphate synthase MoaC [Rubripirellula lacrimiformis]QDT03429.1 Cyclic pyranopterin monophosphate synthase accessory protein [Rubripirellula lacrimiformis]
MSGTPHFDQDGNAHMVDVSAKTPTVRKAVASGELRMLLTTAETIRAGTARKGDVLAVARLAAIQATKWTQNLIPLCHAIPIESVSIDFQWAAADRLRCLATVQTTGKTGVEMEAMTAVSVGCLTVYDMVKGIDREIQIGEIMLLEKSGGKSGHFVRQ